MRAADGLVAAILSIPVPLAAAPAAAACRPEPAPLVRSDAPSWAQRAMAPELITPFADGAGVVVAVLDSGVDGRHAQLRGAVLAGADFRAGGATEEPDCAGHGTAVASLIAASPIPGAALRGLAPGARILPVRVTERRRVGGEVVGEPTPPHRIAEAIRWAVRQGAAVLNLSLVLQTDDPAVRAAVADAVRADVVVVAAVGNDHRTGDPTPYPAAYPGVLGVGAIGPRGSRADESQVGPYVDLVAPGAGVVVAWPGGYAEVEGTSFAAPYASATAALLRQREPGLTGTAVVGRLLATADPVPGGRPAYGHGLLNPYRAVTEAGPATAARPGPHQLAPRRTALPSAGPREQAGRGTALTAAAAGAAGLGLALLAAIVLPRGARRRWTRPVG